MKRIDRYWEQFLHSLPAEQPRPDRYVEAFFFGTMPDRALEITRLVLDGTKTATGSVLWSLEAKGKPIPDIGDYWIVTNGDDDPACIIRTVDSRVIPFDEVSEEYAMWGGEGNRTLESWRKMYWSYILSECEVIKRTPDSKTPLVMERFELLYSEPLADE